MATYEEIYGKRVEVLDADPTLTTAQEGQVWYNSTSGTLKSVVQFSAWSSITGQINAYPQSYGGGTTDAGWICGGYSPGPTKQNRTEEYNGSGWSVGGNLNTARVDIMAAGVQTAGVAAMGDNAPDSPRTMTNTEEYNGSAWTNVNAAPGGMFENCGSCCGTEPAYMAVGGRSGPPQSRQTTTMEYDGTNWSTGGAYPAALSGIYVSGTQTAAIGSCGEPPPPAPAAVNTSAEYNGASWTAVSTSPITRRSGGRSGTQTAALFFGGSPGTPAGTATLTYDGTTFATDPASLSTPMGGQASSTNSPGTAAWSCNPNQVVEEYSKSINTITAAAWASGTALGTGRESMSSAGTQTAALAVGGRVGPPGGTTAVEDYDGSSWESAPVLNTARQYAGGCGTQTAAITYGGGPPEITTTEEFNGSSWSTQPNSMSTARRAFASFGIQTAAVAAGGQTGTAVTAATEEYNGTSWSTSPGSLAQARQYFAGAGIETSGLVFGGSDYPNSTKYTNTEEYGGTSWTTGGVLLTGTSGLMGCGATNTAALAFGGYQPSKVATTVGYDGTAWSSRPSMGGATAEGSGAGTSIAALSIGGSPAETGVEEFTGVTETATASTLTTS